jgi:hypothetical protein
MNLFVGDPEQPALMLPWELERIDVGRFSSPWQHELTWEQREIVEIIGTELW